MKKITVFCEVNSEKNLKYVSYELISKAYDLTLKAKELKNEDYIVEAIALSDKLDDDSIKKAFLAGASRFVFIKDKCLSDFNQTIFTQCFLEFYENNQSDIIIFPATTRGRTRERTLHRWS